MVGISYLIKNNIKERQDVISFINNIFPDIEKFINIGKFEELLANDKNLDNIIRTYTRESDLFGGSELLSSLYYNISQQFCFWLKPDDQSLRVLKSSDFSEVSVNTILNVINSSVTMRKNRFDIVKEISESLEHYPAESISYHLNGNCWNVDFFRKKKNLFLMCLFRYKKDLNYLWDELKKEQVKELIDTINPAIDYQIPKMLEWYGIIKYPVNIKNKIRNGEYIIKDSEDELFIRSLSYLALILIQEQFGYNQIELDWWLWYNRNSLNSTVKHHCTLTEDY